jgi:hypothetical protein
MLTISEDQAPYGCHVRFAEVWLGAGMTGGQVACRFATGQYAVARLEGDRHRASLDSMGRVGVGDDTAITIDAKRLV